MPSSRLIQEPYSVTAASAYWMPPVWLERLVRLAFDQIRQASATTPAVLIRQLDAIRRLLPRLPEACRQALLEEAELYSKQLAR